MLSIAAMALAAAGGLGVGAPLGRAAERPDVLVIVIDDAGWEDFAEGNLDDIQALAGFGRTYTRFQTSPACSPSRYQLMFGRYPHEHFIGTALSPFGKYGTPTSATSIAERMSVEGYATALFGKWHLSAEKQPMHLPEAARIQGFETWRAGSAGNIVSGGTHYSWERIDDGVVSQESTYTTTAITDALIEWWDETDEPRFAVCSYLAPHQPYDFPPVELVPEVQGAPYSNRGNLLFALAGIDNSIAEIASTLDLSNTWVFLLPDNGTPANAAPLSPKSKGYKLSPYVGGINVPMVVWGPGLQPGVDDSLVQISDLPATILELTGSAAIEGSDQSLSFARSLLGGPAPREVVMSHRFTPNGGQSSALTVDDWSVQNADGYKLIHTFLGTQLYNLFSDPWETTPIIDPAIAAELEQARIELLGSDWPYPY